MSISGFLFSTSLTFPVYFMDTALHTETTERLVERIAALQSTGTDAFSEGLFPASRSYRYGTRGVEDTSIFPTAVTIYTLQGIREALSEHSQHLIDEMTRKAIAAYPRYLNNEGWKMYNFWQHFPEERFLPNSRLLSRFRIFHLPEDIDTTAYIYLTQPHSAEDIQWLRQRIVVDTNGNRRHIRNTLPPYKNLKAYSTWLGGANMPIDFDVCALSNLLLFIFENQFPLNEHDHESIRYICMVIDSDDHIHHPFEVAPWYASTTLILYYVVRLVTSFEVPGLDTLRDKLISDLNRQRAHAPFAEQLLISTSLMRLGEPAILTQYPDDLTAAFRSFYFFVGSIFTPIDHPLTWALAKRPLFQFHYRCEAHSLALLLEHEAYRGIKR